MKRASSLSDGIASAIADHLRRGITAGEDSLFYARSSLGLESAEEMGALLALGERDESGLAELVFHPDDELRLAVEPLIPEDGLSAEEVRGVAVKEGDLVPRVRVLLPDGCESIMDIAGAPLERFVGRLNLHISLGFLSDAPPPHSGAVDAVLLCERVMIRNAGFMKTARREDFLRRMQGALLMGSCMDAADFLERLDFMLRLFGESPDDRDVCAMIMEKRNALLFEMNRAREYEEARIAMGMEFLMLKRIHPPVFNPDKTESDLRLADAICRVVCGHEPYESPPLEAFNLGAVR